jgi:hypothetical protein
VEKMMSLEINESMVKPILEKQIQTAILANIGNPEELISKIVSLAMKQKVNSNGEISQYSSDNRFDYLEIITGNAIREAAQEALKQWLEENTQLVKAMVIQEMNKPERQKSLVAAFANAVEESLSCSWRFNCDIKFTEVNNY